MLLLPLIVWVGACSKVTDQQAIGDAQFCLDDLNLIGQSRTQRASAVEGCLSQLGSASSEQAYLMRCAGNFLIEGFGDIERMTSSLEALSSGGTVGSAPVALLGAIAFDKTNPDSTNFARETANYCSQSGSPSYTLMSSMARIATVMNSMDAITFDPVTRVPTGTDVASVIASTEQSAAVGAAAQAAYEESCSGGAEVDPTLCEQFEGIIEGNSYTEAQIGGKVLCLWEPSANGCVCINNPLAFGC